MASCDSAAESSLLQGISKQLLVKVDTGAVRTAAEVSSEADEVEQMDENLWKDLPEELLSPILAGLPLQSIFRLRCVCKKWNTLLHDESFFDRYSHIKEKVPFCVREGDDGYAAYSPASNSWHFWPYSFILSNHSLSMSSTSSVPFWESGAAGGLLLLEGYNNHGRVLHLANPINKSQKQLPLIRELQDSFTSAIVGMVVDKNSGSYKILAVNHGVPDEVFLYDFFGGHFGGMEDEEDAEETFKFYVYDSKSNSWEMTGSWQRGVKKFFQRPAFHNGSLYCLTSDIEAFHMTDLPPVFHVFCVDRESWQELPAQILSPMSFAHLFEMRGRLMLAGGKANKKGLFSVHIWQLEEVDREWVEVLTMPDHLVQALSVPTEPHFRSRFNCVASTDYICVTSYSRKLNKCNTVMCNMVTNFWWLLPTYTKRSTAGTFLFEPRPDVVL